MYVFRIGFPGHDETWPKLTDEAEDALAELGWERIDGTTTRSMYCLEKLVDDIEAARLGSEVHGFIIKQVREVFPVAMEWARSGKAGIRFSAEWRAMI